MLRKLEKYELLEEIGHGGMATVYKARDERLDRLVAIKVLHPHLRKAPEARVRFTREARSVAKLHHPNILEIYDYSGEDSEESYIAAELLTGPTLRRFIDDGAELPAEIAACFTIQIASALAAAHESGIIHRDVKPENVLLHENRCVKLTDFGIAQMVDSQSFTATGQILGSPGHMAPEQVAGTNIDARTDVFSLGTVLFFLAVGRLPFTGRNPHQVLKRIVDAEFPDPLRIRPQIGGELRAVLLKAMARDPDDRFQTVDEFQEALVAFVGRLDVEKPDALLERYLRDPDETTSSLRERALRAYMDLGRKAAEQKDRGAALDALNRVLALDEGNDEALRLIERLSSQDRRARAAGVGAVALGMAALIFALWPGDGPPQRIEQEDAGVLADAAIDAPRDAAIEDAAVEDATPDVSDDAEDASAPTLIRPAGPRMRRVRLLPSPRNVQISIDGAPARPWGAGGIEIVELDVTRPHSLRFLGECCTEVERRVRIPRGEGVHELRQQLLFKPAGLLIECSNCPPGTRVEVRRRGAAGVVSGRVGRVLSVPLTEASQLREYRVTAEGYRTYNGAVTLRSTEPSEEQVTLEREGESAQP